MKVARRDIFKVFLKDLGVLIFIRPVFVIFLNYIMFGDRYFNQPSVLLGVTFVSLLVMVASWRVHIVVDHYLRNRYVHINTAIKRLVFSCCIHMPVSFAMLLATVMAYDYFRFFGFQPDRVVLVQVLICGICSNLASIGFQECVYFFYAWKENWVEAEALKKAHLTSRLNGLKSQVNPHFLFNSINTLSSLIMQDEDKAEQFLSEMCKVYRYFLNGDKRDMVLVAEELAFLRSWFYLLRVRYGAAIQFDLKVLAEDLDKFILPMAIHSVAEYAITHNAINKKTPLLIHVSSGPGNKLVVLNSVNSKLSTGASIVSDDFEENIRSRHKLMGLDPVNIQKNDQFHTVEIPIIE